MICGNGEKEPLKATFGNFAYFHSAPQHLGLFFLRLASNEIMVMFALNLLLREHVYIVLPGLREWRQMGVEYPNSLFQSEFLRNTEIKLRNSEIHLYDIGSA